MTPGIYSLPAAQYFAAEGVSASMLQVLAEKTPAHLKTQMDGEPEKITPAMEFGVILHRALLEPDTYRDGFYIKPPKMNFSTKLGSQWQEIHQDRPILTTEDATAIDKMVSAVHTHPFAKKLLTSAKTEQSIFVEDGTGILRKSRLDALTAGNCLPDVKTSISASLDSFEKTISRLGYHRRAAFYLDNCKLAGLDKQHFFFIVVEKSPPYAVRCLQLMPEVIQAGRMLYGHDLQIYRNCLETGLWPAWGDNFEECGLPSYEMRALEQLAA